MGVGEKTIAKRALAAGFAALLGVLPCLPVSAQEAGVVARLSGPARVIDGDRLEIGGWEIRLAGIDAPESVQSCHSPSGIDWPCGQLAAETLAGHVEGKEVICRTLDIDSEKRLIARCVVGEEDLGGLLVREGWGIAFDTYAPRYMDSEDTARAEGLGIWSGTFLPPAQWRSIYQQAGEATSRK